MFKLARAVQSCDPFYDSAVLTDKEARRQCRQTAVCLRNFIVAHQDGVIHLQFTREFPNLDPGRIVVESNPDNLESRVLYLFCRSTNQGVITLQGPHQVAQKYRSTVRPRKSESRTVSPLTDSRVKSGAGLNGEGPKLAPEFFGAVVVAGDIS